MLDRDELPGYRIIPHTRVSDPSGSSEASHDRQSRYIDDEIEILKNNYSAEIVEEYNLSESASTMDREAPNKIVEKAKNDEFDILMVWAIHRLTRANAWETFNYLLELRKYGVVIYSDRDGYYDWDDPDDAELLADRITTSREWRNEIDRGARDSNRLHLREGRWPYGTPPYGTTKKDIGDEDDDDDHELVLKSGYEWVPEKCFSKYKDGMRDEKETSEHISTLIENKNIDINPPTQYQVENILENEVFVGKLVLKRTGELVREKEDLKCVDPELFATVQEIRRDDDPEDNQQFSPHDFPEFVYRLILRYGQEYVVENVNAIRWCCPKCDSIDINISDTTVEFWDINIPKIYCKDSQCEYNGPAIRMKELHNIDSTLPLICPECQRTGKFDVEPVSIKDNEDYYKYTCKQCEEFMIKDKHPNSVQRGINNPTNSIDLKSSGNGQDASDEPDSKNTTSTSKNEDTDSGDPREDHANGAEQTYLNSFT